MLHEEITGKILQAAFEVAHELGSGFVESVYEKALLIALQEKGLKVTEQQPIKAYFRSQEVGEFFADLFVEDKVIVELKAVKALASEHQAQVINYLKASGIEVGLLINFGTAKIEYKRLVRQKRSK